MAESFGINPLNAENPGHRSRKVMQARQIRSTGSIWSLPMLCLGLGIIAICVLVPAAQANRKLTADRDKLARDLTFVESQVSANQEFLSIAGSDPEISERLAQRQLKQIRQGTTVLDLKGFSQTGDASPFQMISVPPPPPAVEYRAAAGILGTICADSHRQLYAVGLGMFMVATALVLGTSGLPHVEG